MAMTRFPSRAEKHRGEPKRILTKNKTTMRDFLKKMMSDDETQKTFTKREFFKYGILMPLAFFAIMGLAGWLETCI